MVSKIEGEQLQPDPAMANLCRLELQDALEQWDSLALDLTAYKVNVDRVQDQHHLKKYIGWGENGVLNIGGGQVSRRPGSKQDRYVSGRTAEERRIKLFEMQNL
jgi:hypothetical protein